MTGCSADDVVMEKMTAPEEGGVAISFCCNYDDETPITKAGHLGEMNDEDLHTTGFGAMASVTADKKPTLMYNQEVAFTLVGDLDDPKKGYWSYAPKKYWPTDLTDCYISAYAPYVEPSDLEGLPADETGIYGISANNVAPYIDYRRCEKPGEQVDLLWYYEEPSAIPAATALNEAGTLAMKMRHALARLDIKVALAADPGTTKVLIEEIILTGKMAKTGRLSLCSQTTEGSGVDTKYYPVWTNQEFDKDGDVPIDHTFKIKNADNDPESYGIIESQVRYIPNLPYGWQPAGLSTTPQDALNTGDRKGYVYLIPQDELTLTITVKYKKWVEGEAEPTSGAKTTTVTPTSIANPLRGNKTYTLNLTLSGI
ncbi:MAG: fimbrillin family protein [Bacteroidaceae bacterium]|nr:fimbrillin family protein [Bacteroidaceae bacterium]